MIASLGEELQLLPSPFGCWVFVLGKLYVFYSAGDVLMLCVASKQWSLQLLNTSSHKAQAVAVAAAMSVGRTRTMHRCMCHPAASSCRRQLQWWRQASRAAAAASAVTTSAAAQAWASPTAMTSCCCVCMLSFCWRCQMPTGPWVCLALQSSGCRWQGGRWLAGRMQQLQWRCRGSRRRRLVLVCCSWIKVCPACTCVLQRMKGRRLCCAGCHPAQQAADPAAASTLLQQQERMVKVESVVRLCDV